MAMNKQELSDYKDGLVEELKNNELAQERLKMLISNQKKYIALLEKQIEAVEEKPLV